MLDDRDFDDLVTTIHLISETIYEHGFADRILAAVFKFHAEGRDAYWTTTYKRGRFYPLTLSGHQQRDNVAEMRMGTVMEGEDSGRAQPRAVVLAVGDSLLADGRLRQQRSRARV